MKKAIRQRQALRRIRGMVGETVFLLCARVDVEGVDGEDCEPAIVPRSLSWLSVTVVREEPRGDVWVRYPDGSETAYRRSFLLSREEASALRLPKVSE